MEILNDANFMLYCAKNYNNPTCTGTDEFLEDIKRIKYVKKLLTRYVETGELKERLILNHIIVLGNVFNPVALNRIMFLKIENQFGMVKPFLMMIGMLSEKIENVRDLGVVESSMIVMDQGIIDSLRKIVPVKVEV